ncbi:MULTISPECIES: VOC family protein [unclassified Streptomyces]|uniref:VOC family protein n=1 Tax=unclassified Streptomyces TaxID=2593676 RepID=UPI000374DC5E|nr:MULTISPECIES: VOC family protein [unclassified Streptomyces]MYT33870.1 VOC family protein [Streptomyces sp. SID8354]
MALITLGVVAVDCPDPRALARFYAAVLDWEVVDDGRLDWVEVAGPDGRTLAFQRAENYRPPQWPGQEVPQQLHLDFDVRREDIEEAERKVLALGARPVPHEEGERDFRVYLDPAGHPFCLCLCKAE